MNEKVATSEILFTRVEPPEGFSADVSEYDFEPQADYYKDAWPEDASFDEEIDFSPQKNRDITRRSKMSGPSGANRRRTKNQEVEFLSRASQILGVSEEQARELFSARKIKSIRTNAAGFDPETSRREQATELSTELDLESVAHSELSWFGGAFLFNASDMQKVVASKAVSEGRGFIQSPTSYMPVLALEAENGNFIVDVCAAPGGKAALIADLVGSSTVSLVANELKARRLERMRSLLDMLMLQSIQTTHHDAKHLPKILGKGIFDRVLADVECSTEAGVNFESHEPLKGWSRERVERSAMVQRQILRASYDMLKPGGILVYSTCSLAPEENEGVITALLDTRKDAIVQPMAITVEDRVQPIRRWGSAQFPVEASSGVVRIKPTEYLEPFTVTRIRKPTDDPQINEAMQSPVNIDELTRLTF